MNANPSPTRIDNLLAIISEIVYDLSGIAITESDPRTCFLEMGFDSLFLTQAGQAFQSKFGVKVTFRDLLDAASSPYDLAALIDSKLPVDKFQPVAPIQAEAAPEPPVAATEAVADEPSPSEAPSRDQSAHIAVQQAANATAFRPVAQQPHQPSGAATAVESLIAQQLQIMQQQLAVLAAHGFATPTNFPSSSPMQAMGAVAPSGVSSYEEIKPAPVAPAPAPEPVVAAAPPSSAPPADDPAPKPVGAHGPFRPIERGDTSGFSTRQQAHIERLIARYGAKTPASKAYTAKHRAHLADPRVVAGFKQAWKEIVYPIVATHSGGSRLWDVDGNEYVDVTLGFGVNMLGHRPEFVMRAIEEQLHQGIEIGPQSPLAGDVAQMICEMTGMDRVTFCNTGSEAVMAAVRVARTVTGRDKVVYFSGDYHGTHDEVLLRANNINGRLRSLPIAPGIPRSAAEQTIILEYGAPESLAVIEQLADEIAAVLVEPVQSRNPSLQPHEFVHELRRITSEHGAALIFDEVITGFRSHPGGAQAVYGISADLATYGKVIGGGMPFGVVAGKREFMDAFDGGSWQFGDASFPEVGVTFFAGTFVRHPLAMAAAHAMLTYLKEQGPALQERLSTRTAEFVGELNRHFVSVGAPLDIPHFSSNFYIHFDSEVKYGSLLWYHLREKGIHIWEGRPCFLSTAHSEEDIAYITWAFKASVAEMQEAGFLAGHTPALEAVPFPASAIAQVTAPPVTPELRLVSAEPLGVQMVELPEPLGGAPYTPDPAIPVQSTPEARPRVSMFERRSKQSSVAVAVRPQEPADMTNRLSLAPSALELPPYELPSGGIALGVAVETHRPLVDESGVAPDAGTEPSQASFGVVAEEGPAAVLPELPLSDDLVMEPEQVAAEPVIVENEAGEAVQEPSVAEYVSVADPIVDGNADVEVAVPGGADEMVSSLADVEPIVEPANVPFFEAAEPTPVVETDAAPVADASTEVDENRVVDATIVATIDEISGDAPASAEVVITEAVVVETSLPDVPAAAAYAINVPLTEQQREVWLATRMGDDASRAFDESLALHLRGFFDFAAFQGALDTLVSRHEALRTTFASDGTSQTIAPHYEIKALFTDLSDYDLLEGEAELDRLLTAESAQLFDLEQGPLFSAHVIRIDERYHVVSLTGHHLVLDGWSFGIVLHELSSLYTELTGGEATPLGDPMAMSVYAEEQAALALHTEQTPDERYWLNILEGELPALELPVDRPRGPMPTYRGACETLRIPGGLLTSLRQLGAKHGSTLFATMFASWAALLQRLTGQQDIIVGIPAAGQQMLENDNLMGHCVNVLPIRFQGMTNVSFVQHMLATKRRVLDAMDHQSVTFGSLLRSLDVARDTGQSALVSAIFNIDRQPVGLKFGDLALEITTNPRSYYQFDIGLNVVEYQNELLIEANYNSDLFDASTIRRWLSHYETLLAALPADPSRSISTLPILSDAEYKQIVLDWNNTATDYPRATCVHRLFEQVAAANPDAVAATLGRLKITYLQLNAYANQLARHLHTMGIGPSKFVGIQLDRSLEMLIGLLAVLKAGAAYLPLDPGQPAERTTEILADAGCDVVLTQHNYGDQLGVAGRRVVFLDTDWDQVMKYASENLPSVLKSTDPVYVMFTSGSTGKPKGVVVSHRAVVRLVRSGSYVDFGPNEVILAMAPLAFDASTFEIWGALLNGGRVAMAPPGNNTLQEISEVIKSSGVTTVWLTAGLFHTFIDLYPQGLTSVKQLLAGGDVLSVSHVAKAMEKLPNVKLVNGYGPTENTTFTTTRTIEPPDLVGASVPIGSPLPNTTVYIVDELLQPQPIGIEGELLTGGDGLSAGYLNRDDLTQERFIVNPFSNDPDSRLYRTGDRARWLPDGAIEFLGRKDQQVKLRGYRIELGEIEQAINLYPNVRESVVVAKSVGDSDKRLVAYIVPQSPKGIVDSIELRAHLAATLPSYMIPAAFVTLPEIPLNTNGKPDRAKLPEPDEAQSSVATSVDAPKDDIEAKVIAIWERLLGRGGISRADNFWHLGGHSLLAVRLFVEIEKEFDKRLPLPTLFKSPTVELLADAIRGPIAVDAWDSLVPIQPNGSRPPIYCVHHIDGVVVCYRELAQYLGEDQPVWGIQAQGLDGIQTPGTKVETIAAKYVEDIIKVNPTGPYLLCGLSFGGVVAFEIACQLRAGGRHVDFVGLIDTYGPDYFRQEPNYEKERPLFMRTLDQFHALRGLEGNERKTFLSQKLKNGINRLKKANGLNVVADDVKDYLPEALKAIKEANEKALLEYYPKAYPGELILFRAAERLDRKFTDPLLAWGSLAEDVIVREVLGNHYTIIQEPFVQKLALEMRFCMDTILGSE
ncbi:MAG TPA: amino acid adenylation domain-containing protein [Capsulimonadaceae bacterium]|jgi:aspartate racemase